MYVFTHHNVRIYKTTSLACSKDLSIPNIKINSQYIHVHVFYPPITNFEVRPITVKIFHPHLGM